MSVTQETLNILLLLVVLIISAIYLNRYRIKRQYKTNTKGLQYVLGETIIKDTVNLGFYNTLTKEIEWIYVVSYDYSKKKNNKYLPILIKKYYDKDSLQLFNDINLYSSISQVQLRNQLELETYNALLDKYKNNEN